MHKNILTENTHYDFLGIENDATLNEIKRAYRIKIKKCHPDLNPDYKEGEEDSKKANEVWEILKDPEQKSNYDLRFQYEDLESSEENKTPSGYEETMSEPDYTDNYKPWPEEDDSFEESEGDGIFTEEEPFEYEESECDEIFDDDEKLGYESQGSQVFESSDFENGFKIPTLKEIEENWNIPVYLRYPWKCIFCGSFNKRDNRICIACGGRRRWNDSDHYGRWNRWDGFN